LPIDLGPVIDHMPAWLMVLFRLTGIFIFAPVFGSPTIPRQVKVFMVVGLSLCVYPTLLDSGRDSALLIEPLIGRDMSLWFLIPQIAVELLLGLIIGYAASLPLIGMQVGGQVIGQQMGLGFAQVVNPESREQSSLIGQVLFMMALAIFVILGGHRLMFATLVSSFNHIPLGGFNDFAALTNLIVGLLAIMFELAVQVAAPLICLLFLVTVAMGFIARTVPQFNILSVGFAIRILSATAVFVAFVAVAAGAFTEVLSNIMGQLVLFFTM
jgi:flagellar biosynthetic protein FliR